MALFQHNRTAIFTLFISCSFGVFLVYVFLDRRTYNTWTPLMKENYVEIFSKSDLTTDDKVDARMLQDCMIDDNINPSDPRFYNLILEEDALKYKPCVDAKLAASPEHSKLRLVGNHKKYRLGEVVRVLITLYDSYGKMKTTGGDQLRATIYNPKTDAHAPGVVTDYKNGSYIAELKTFWTGSSTVQVSIAYPRELITALYRVRTEVLGTRNIRGQYSSRTYQESQLCHPNTTRLAEAFNNTEVCDFTYENSGMPFYCLKPKDEHLLCQDLANVKIFKPYPVLSYTDCEKALLKRSNAIISQNLTTMVTVNTTDPCSTSSETPCSKLDRRLLWSTRQPSGYFVNKTWHNVLCKGVDQSEARKCLRNKHIYMFGDSTLRAWYKYIVDNLECRQTTEKWTTRYWHKESKCKNDNLNFTASWCPHTHPFFAGQKYENIKHMLSSTPRKLDDISNEENAVVIIHQYLHFIAYRHSVFEERMKLIRLSIEKLLKRNNKVLVMIKAPHTFKSSDRLSDYFGYVYSMMLYDIFSGLHDRIVLLNTADATSHLRFSDIHPPNYIDAHMCLKALSFVCGHTDY